jgi:uracil phosphoribosyltransferase
MSNEVFEKNNHPLILHYLTRILAVDVLAHLTLDNTTVETPMETTSGHGLNQRIGLIPIMRAGLGLVDPILELIPEAEVWHLGLYRDEQTLEPVEYYQKLPADQPVDIAIILDPMLATGGSAIAAMETVRRWGVQQIIFMGVLAAPKGIEAVHAAFPDTPIYICKIDSHLNEIGYIIPGLGDAGDRIFNAAAE